MVSYAKTKNRDVKDLLIFNFNDLDLTSTVSEYEILVHL